MKHIKVFESRQEIEDLQVNLDELMWGNIEGEQKYFARYFIDDIKSGSSWYIPIDTKVESISNKTLKEYLFDNEVTDVMGLNFKQEIDDHGYNDKKLNFLTTISFTGENILFIYFDHNKNFLHCHPISVSKTTKKNVISSEKNLCYDVCMLFKDYEFGKEKFGQLNWDWFKQRFELKLRWD
jgi:hypothetical protein